MPALHAQGTPAGTHIRNWATLGYSYGGVPYTLVSDTVDLLVGQVAGVSLQPPRTGSGSPGASAVFAHTLSNLGNGPDSFAVAGASLHGWPVTLYRDWNADGVLDAGDSVVTGPLALGPGATAALLVQVTIPGAGSAGVTDTVTVTATSRFNPAVSASVRDRLDVSSPPIAIALTKQVDRLTASAGDVLTYTLGYTASGGGTASAAQLADTIPAGASYVTGTLRWNGTPLTDAADADAGSYAAAGNGIVVFTLGPLSSGATGSVTFQVRVGSPAPATVANRGNVAFTWSGGADTTLSNAVQTTILVPALSLAKQLTSPSPALVGQQVRYTVRYANAAGAGSAQSVVLTDTLPVGLQYVSATPAASVAGQVLTWALGTLAAGDSGAIDLVLAVAPTVRDTVVVTNVAWLQGQGTGAVAAAATPLTLIGPPAAVLGLDLTAGVLEVPVGGAIPYAVTVRNPGTLSVTDIRVTVQLPVGARYVPGSAIGVDSAVVSGGQVVLFSAAALAPGADRTLRFVAALVTPPGPVAEARAVASGQVSGGPAASPQAIAWVQVSRAWPMETRAAIGKVWVDVNGNGIQDAGEAGIGNVDIWTEDGQVATTDSSGKFSFTNLRPGRHAFRIDSRSLPRGYRLASDDIRLVEASGWTTPRVDFRLAPAGAQRVGAPRQAGQAAISRGAVHGARARLPVAISFAAQPLADAARSATSLADLHHARVRYELTVRQPANFALDAVVSFMPLADSAIVYVDGAQFTRYSWLDNIAIPIPPARPNADIRVVAWSSERQDSVTVRLVAWPPAHGDEATWPRLALRLESLARAPVRAPASPIVVTDWVPVGDDPIDAGSVVDSGAALARAPSEGMAPRAESLLVAPLRTAAARAAERSADAVRGPGVEIFAPQDGAVLVADHAYIGVKGEPNEPVVLYDGAKAVDSGRTRIDGVFDFVSVPLARGPHHLRVALRNSWSQERWDSVAVHITGLPARFEAAGRAVRLTADGRSTAVVNVRVLDRWGVPVAQPAYVTVSARGAEPLGPDADASSVGLQLLSTPTGRLAIAVRAGRTVGRGVLELSSGEASDTVPLELLPEVRGLAVAGSGMVGVGASPDAYGAVTARGRLDSLTSFTLGLDSRRLRDGRDVFGRSADPLEESQYPILGDASTQLKRTASETWLSARVERGYDWAAFGDLSTTGFASDLSLAQYQRAVTGVAAQVTTGAVTWSGFGSLTSQALRQAQIRGAGISGPYQVAPDILPGTEHVRVETRDAFNPERAVATQDLVRFVDYQVDYTGGVLLFKQPIPAADANGNPVFIVVTFEAATGGEQRLVAGGRAALDLTHVVGGVPLDVLRIGVTGVSARQAVNGYRLIGGDVRALRAGALDVRAEVAYAEQGDSTGVAVLARASYGLFGGALTVGSGYMRVGREFTNPSNVALQPGLVEENVKGGLKFGGSVVRAEYAHQDFALQGVEREHGRLGIEQAVGRGVHLEAGVARDQVGGGSLTASTATAADLKMTWNPSPRLGLWTEARRQLEAFGPELSPEVWGVGAAYRIAPAVSLEASERYVSRRDSLGKYSVSSIGVRAEMAHGSEAWGSYQLTGGVSGAGNAALIGLRDRLQLSPALAVSVLFERRQGVGGASLADPVRALPFLQAEDDYWSAGAGLELLPKGAPYRLAARAEYKDGTLQSTRLATLAGDVAFDASLALLSRQEFSQYAVPGAALSRVTTSLWGLALRPAHSDRLNVLAKFQWTDARNPLGGGVLVSGGEERRVIGAAEAIWSPVPSVELDTRYAVRRTQAVGSYSDSTHQTLTSWADYVGGRMSVDLSRWLSVRTEGRLLVERTTGATVWDGAPEVALRPVAGLEISTGYRFGDLTDPDFSVRGGHGAFVTLSAAVTEKLFPTAAAFWRSRF